MNARLGQDAIDASKLPRVPDEFQHLLDQVDWTAEGAQEEARLLVRGLVSNVLYYWRKRGRRFPISFVALVRNICATAPRSAVPALRVFLNRLVADSRGADRAAFQAILEALPAGRSGVHAIALKLALTEEPLTGAERRRLRDRRFRLLALAAIQERRFDDPDLAHYLRLTSLKRERSAILKTLRDSRPAPGAPDPIGAGALRWFQAELVTSGLAALVLVSLEKADRARFVAGLDDGELRGALDALSEDEIDSLLLSAEDLTLRYRLLKLADAPARRRTLVGKWVQQRAGKLTGEEVRAVLAAGCASEFLACAARLDAPVVAELESPLVREMVHAALRGPMAAVATLSVFSDAFLTELFTLYPELARKAATAPTRTRWGVRPPPYAERLHQLVIRVAPGAYIAEHPDLSPAEEDHFVGLILSGERLSLEPDVEARLLGRVWARALAAADWLRAAQILVACRQAPGPRRLDLRLVRADRAIPFLDAVVALDADIALDLLSAVPWKEGARRVAGSRAQLPDSVRGLILTAGGPDLKAAADVFPRVFGEALVDAFPPEEILDLALRHPAIGRRLEHAVPRSELVRLIPLAVRRAPNAIAAAAHEVALAFSLADARFLLAAAYRVLGHVREGSLKEIRGRRFDDLYHVHELPKKCGGKRRITAPDGRLKKLQRRIVENGFRRLELPDPVHGFRPGRSIVSNAMPHVGCAMVVNVDIDDFFPTTSYRQVVRACYKLCDLGLSERAALFVADLCSFQGALPTGAPTSPYIANLVLASVDRALTTVCERAGWHYTRYADDLTFSGQEHVTTILPFVGRILGQLGYQLDPEKTNVFRRGRRQMVTGLVVNVRPNLPRTIRRRIRAAVQRVASGQPATWHGAEMSDAALRGRLAVLRMVSPAEAERHLARLGWSEPPAGHAGSEQLADLASQA